MTRPETFNCLCASCGEDFGSTSAFDAHRTGRHDILFLATDPGTGDGRRCLAPDEMRERGMHKDSRGRWRRGGDSPNPHATGRRRQPELWSARRAAA